MSSTRHRQRGDRTTTEFTGRVNPWVRVEREHVFREGTEKQSLGYQWIVSPSGTVEEREKKKVVHVAALSQSVKVESDIPPLPHAEQPTKKTLKLGSIKLKVPLKK